MRAAQFTSPFTLLPPHLQHTHRPSFAGAVLVLSYPLFIWLALFYITFQSAKFLWLNNTSLWQASVHTHMHICMLTSTQTQSLVLPYNVIMGPTESNYSESINPVYLLGKPCSRLQPRGMCTWVEDEGTCMCGLFQDGPGVISG